MIKKNNIIWGLILLLLPISCERLVLDKNPLNTPASVFEVFWTNLDQKYVYFSFKGIDWDSVYQEYKPRINNDMHPDELWGTLSNMLCVLNDGHVSLSDNEKWSNWWNCRSRKYNTNFDYNLIVNNYLGKPLKYSGPLLYDKIDSVGYIYYSSFETTVSGANMDFLVNYFKDTRGIIFDIRGNGGGDSENGDIIESRLLSAKTLVEYIYYKNGPGHNDFTSPQELYILPEGNEQYLKPIAILINRDCFSSASFFASRMSVLPHVSLIGDTTSGGAGRPKYFDLPNGWIVRYSSNYALRADSFNFENGVPPDYWIEMLDSERLKGIDTIIEYAISWINSQ